MSLFDSALRTIVASYDSECPLCGMPIVGEVDEIVCLDDQWVHAKCAEDEGAEVAW